MRFLRKREDECAAICLKLVSLFQLAAELVTECPVRCEQLVTLFMYQNETGVCFNLQLFCSRICSNATHERPVPFLTSPTGAGSSAVRELL